MKACSSWPLKTGVGALFLITAFGAQALDTQLTLQADGGVSPTNNELVTFGLPIAAGEVLEVGEIRVTIEDVEVSAYVEAGLRYHWQEDNSIRSVTVQLDNIDMTGGNITVRITDAGSAVERAAERDHSEGWATAGPEKSNHSYPRIFALHDKNYLAQSGLISPYEAAPSSPDAFEDFRFAQFENWAGGLDFSTSTRANWLFDRSTAMFKSYIATGRVEFLKEAFLSKQFYFSYVRNDGTVPSKSEGDGCWEYDGSACNDGKYIAPQQAKLAWALVGDHSQWDEELIVNMALQADIGNYQAGSRDEFNSENESFTERAAGLVGLTEINVYEMTANATVFQHLVERIGSLKDMQQTEKEWDLANGWIPKSGAMTHNVNVHEGDSASLGASNERGFSVWMSENIVEFLWQTYWLTGNTDIPEILRRLSNAVDLYGFTSSYNSVTGDYDAKPEFVGNQAQACNTTRESTDMVYFASAFADAETRTGEKVWWDDVTDNHNIETVLTLSAGYYFEEDQSVRTRLKARIDKLIEGWSNSACASVSATKRLWNWQHRSNSVRTWAWIADDNNAGGTDEIVIVSPPASPGSLLVAQVGSGSGSGGSSDSIDDVAVFIASTDCVEGDDPHWECGGQWVPYSSVDSGDYIAVCLIGEAAEYTDCMNDDQFMLFSEVDTGAAGYFVCVLDVILGVDRSAGCSDTEWVFYDNFGDIGAVNSGGDDDSDGGSDDDDPDGDSDGGSGGGDSGGDSGGGGLVSFSNVTVDVIDVAPQVVFHFWAGMPDVNGDGCFDVFVGAHEDSVDSAMYLHDNVGGACQGTFTHFADDDNYSQESPQTPRITSRYMFGNWYNHPEGLWSYYGHDVDGNPGARYVLSADSGYGDNPSYLAKDYGCYDSNSICIPLDVTGDGDIEFVINSFDDNTPLSRQIVNALDGAIEYPSDVARDDDYGTSYVVFDVNNNGFPEVILTHAGGYFQYSESTNNWSWVSGVFTNPISSDETYSTTNNHEVALDYDRDGDIDIWSGRGVYGDDAEMAFVLSRNNGDGTFTDVSSAAGLDSLEVESESYWTTYGNSVVADLNLDGYPDILISGESYGNNVIIMMNDGDGTFTVDRTVAFGQSYVDGSGKPWVNTADYDGDGLIDVVKTHEPIGDNHASVALFKNTVAVSNHWLRVRVRGFGQNTDGLHTRVTFLEPGTNNILSHYQVGAFTTGYQNLVTHAGVGEFDRVDLLVEYPHEGPSYRFENIAADQDVIVFHDGGIIEGYSPGQPIPLSAN